MRKKLTVLAAALSLIISSMPVRAADDVSKENVIYSSGTDLRYLVTDYTTSNFRVTAGKAICQSKIVCSGRVTKITATQYLEKKTSSRWKIEKVWIKTVNGSTLNMYNAGAAVSDGTYCLRTVFKIYNGTAARTITKYSNYKIVSRGIIIADEEPDEYYQPEEDGNTVTGPQPPADNDNTAFEEEISQRAEQLREYLIENGFSDDDIEKYVSNYIENLRTTASANTSAGGKNDIYCRELVEEGRVWKDGKWVPGEGVYDTSPTVKLTDKKGALSGGAVYDYDPELRRLIIGGVGSFDPVDYENLYSSFDFDYVVIGKDVTVPASETEISMEEGISINPWILRQTDTSGSCSYEPRFIVMENSDFMAKYDETSRYGFGGNQNRIQHFIENHEVVMLPEAADPYTVVYDKEYIPRTAMADIDENSYWTYIPGANRISIVGTSDTPVKLNLLKFLDSVMEYAGGLQVDTLEIYDLEVSGCGNDHDIAKEYIYSLLTTALKSSVDKYSVKLRKSHRYEPEVTESKVFAESDGVLDGGAGYHYDTDKKALIIDGTGDVRAEDITGLISSFEINYIVFGKAITVARTAEDTESGNSQLMCSLPAADDDGYVAVYCYKNSDFAKKYTAYLDYMAEYEISRCGNDFTASRARQQKLHPCAMLADSTDPYTIFCESTDEKPYVPEIVQFTDGMSWMYDPEDHTLQIIGRGAIDADALVKSVEQHLDGCPIENVEMTKRKNGSDYQTVAGYENSADAAEAYLLGLISDPGVHAADDGVIIMGDADLNGTVSLSDPIAISKSLISPNCYFLNDKALKQSDVNKDNYVDTVDVSRLIEYLLGHVPYSQLCK